MSSYASSSRTKEVLSSPYDWPRPPHASSLYGAYPASEQLYTPRPSCTRAYPYPTYTIATEEHDWHHTPRPSYASSSSLYGAYPTYTDPRPSYSSSLYGTCTRTSDEEEEEEEEAYKPEELSMKETVRRQLQTVSFTVGIKVFRARRRLRRVLHRGHA
ncbi:hypothetical protein CPB85DRAFT_1440738 [Mucidula mucida]|nr:hypothetical protein CPB85DRAFT_1440738 [Mucidula mucida]